MPGATLLRSTGTEEMIPLPISSITVAVGDLLFLTAGTTTWVLGTSSTTHWQQKAIATAAATTAETSVLAVLVIPGQMYEMSSANNSSATHNGDRMVLTDEDQVNNTGTDSTAEQAVFVQYGIIGAVADKRVYGTIVYGSGVDPDAA